MRRDTHPLFEPLRGRNANPEFLPKSAERQAPGHGTWFDTYPGRGRLNNADGPPAIEDTKWMISVYPDDIRGWINSLVGHLLEPAPERYWRLPARELWKMGYRRCGD